MGYVKFTMDFSLYLFYHVWHWDGPIARNDRMLHDEYRNVKTSIAYIHSESIKGGTEW